MTGETGSEFEHLYRIERFMASMSDLDELLAVIIREAALATNAVSSSLALYDERADELQFCVARGKDDEREFEGKLKRVRIPMGSGVIGWCATRREPLNIKDAYSDDRFNKEVDKKTGFVTKTILAIPMVRRDRLIGVVEAVNKQDDDVFSEHDEQVLSVLAAQAALVIENARLHEENIQQARLSALGQGIAGAAHCIKNILNGIQGGGYVLDLGIKREDMGKISKGWDILSRNTGIMKDLVLDMLAYSRPREPEYEPSDPNKVCGDVAHLMEEKGREKNVEVSLALDDNIGEIVLDPKGIFRCVLNLVGNAVDACDKEAGSVRLGTRLIPEEKRLEIAVADNGCGIDEEGQKKLFTVFFSTKGSKGTGLGLAVTQKIIREHGGDIRVESELDVGTTFIIDLPLEPPAKRPAQSD